METIGSLQLRNFVRNHKDEIIESNKVGIREAIPIPVTAYMDSKPYLSQARVQVVPYNGQELLGLVLDKINEILPSQDRQWGDIITYKNYTDFHGYTDRIKNDTHKTPILTPDIPVSEVAFGKFITKINLLGDNSHTLTLAVKWEPNTMEVAIGTDVRICDNFNIFTKEQIIRSNIKFTYEQMMDYIEEQLQKAEQLFHTDLATIGRLINVPLNAKTVAYLLGDMSIRYAEDRQVITATDHNELVRNIVAGKKEGKEVANMWDLTNHGTNVLRINKSGSNDPLADINRFNAYILDIASINKGRAN